MFAHHPATSHHRRHHRDPRYGHGHPGIREMFAAHGRSGRPAMRRGEIRPLILTALAQKPMHGYEVIQDLEARSGGRWRPSAGSIYPTLQQLADEGLVTSEDVEGRRTYTLTDAGKAAAADAPSPDWGDATDSDDVRRFFSAVMQVERVGSPEARREMHRILADARRELYRLLAEDGAAGGGTAGADEA
jgi:DNA-binding PadR family transcriptional regulator